MGNQQEFSASAVGTVIPPEVVTATATTVETSDKDTQTKSDN